MKIGQAITNIRKENHLSQEQFAEALQVSRQTISNWENEKSYPDLSMMVTISDKFNISLDYFLKEDKNIVTTIDKKVKGNKVLKISLVLLSLLCIVIVTNLCIKNYKEQNIQKENNIKYQQILDNIKTLGFKNDEIGFYSLTEDNTTYKIYTKKPEVITSPNFIVFHSLDNVLILIDYQGTNKVAVTYIAEEKTTLYCNKKGKLFNDKQNKTTAKIYNQYQQETTSLIQRMIELYTEIYNEK